MRELESARDKLEWVEDEYRDARTRVDAAGLEYRVVNAGVSGDTSAGGLRRLAWLLRLPVVGGLTRKILTARFARTLATLLNNGVHLLPALDIASEIEKTIIATSDSNTDNSGYTGAATTPVPVAVG